LRLQVLGSDQDEFSLTTFAGRSGPVLRDVLDALATASLFGGGRRMVVVDEADEFVSAYRGELEDYVAKPRSSGVLVLDVKTWPSTTRLAKAVAASGLSIECKPLNESQTKRWLTDRAKSRYDVRLDAAAADVLLELLPPEFGILDQELSKLSLLVSKSGTIDVAVVAANVGGWRTRTTWDMVDAAADGRAAEALEQLGRLILAGEKPHGLLPQMSHSLRQLAAATHLIESAEAAGSRLSLQSALQLAGVPPFKLATAERQLRQLGRGRAKQLTAWLLAADLAIKGHNSADVRARLEIERLIVQLAAANNRLSSQPSRPTLAR
jgi:DNA polymerase-3 subunit delta